MRQKFLLQIKNNYFRATGFQDEILTPWMARLEQENNYSLFAAEISEIAIFRVKNKRNDT